MLSIKVKNPSSLRPLISSFLTQIIINRSFSSLPPPFLLRPPSVSSTPDPILDIDPKHIASSFNQWFQSFKPTIFDEIYEILSSHESDTADAALSRLALPLSEEFVLRVLAHRPTRNADVLPHLKFFDWAGHQSNFCHTRATYHAIFKILSKAKLMTVMLRWLQSFNNNRSVYRVQFYNTLVMGYAVAGKPDVALNMLARMRFNGLDLDAFSYHVLLNALVEEGFFDFAEVVSKQITMRGLENDITSCIRMKNLCRQNRLEDAEAYLRELESSGGIVNDNVVGVLVTALCKHKKFEEACGLVEEFGQSGKVPMAPTYSIWIRELINARKAGGALNFIHSKKLEDYTPGVLCYNKLIYGLLREDRLNEVYDLFVEMRECQIMPDKLTMNAALCFFCKAEMVDVAVELYRSRMETGLSPNSSAFNHLISALCGDGSIDEACQVLEDSVKQGYFPGIKTFNFLADALCREGKLDKMDKLVDIARQKNIKPSNAVCVKYISALCMVGKVEEAYMMPAKFEHPNNVLNRYTYSTLIRGFSQLKRGDMAWRLLLEMQESGHTPTKSLYRVVICCLCELGNVDQVLNLLDRQLSHYGHDCRIYNYFINAAGHAMRPDLAREVFERMLVRGIQPNIETKIGMLLSYLRSKRISDALNFFNDLDVKCEPGTTISNRLYSIMIVGLCNAGKPDLALEWWNEVREKGLIPSLHCYEELVLTLCREGDYDRVVKVLKDLQKTGRRVSSFIANVLLVHTLKNREFNQAWIRSGDIEFVESSSPDTTQKRNLSSDSSMLGELIGAFSGGIHMMEHVDCLEEVIAQFFPVDIYTCNMLLRALTQAGRMDCACDLFDRIWMKGYEPNRWTYDIIVHGFCKRGRQKYAKRWMEKMYRNGFYPTKSTMDAYNNMDVKGG